MGEGWLLFIAGLLLAVSLVLAILLLGAQRQMARNREEVEKAVALAFDLRRLRANQQFQTGLLSKLPHFAGRLYGQDSVREIPGVILDIVQDVFEPEEALVLLRRKRTMQHPERKNELIVAAATGAAALRAGRVVTIGDGQLGQVAQRKQTLDRSDLERDPLLRHADATAVFRLDVAAPMLVDEHLAGLVAVSRPHKRRLDDKVTLRLIAQLGALAMNHLSALRQMKSVADLDSLTGVFNKGVLTYRLSELVYTAGREQGRLALFLFDIDHFKSFNDVNGHLAGDQLLRRLAALVEEEVRADDIFGRYGGEEFLLLLPGRTAAEGEIVAESVRRRIEAEEFAGATSQPLGRITISGGVAAFPDHGDGSSELIQAADEALYEAKRAGRNRVVRAVAGGFGVAADTEAEILRSAAEAALESGGGNGSGDDLTAIRGIGSEYDRRLRELGIDSYRQIADLNWQTVQNVADQLGLAPERVIRDRWIEQARNLLEKSQQG